MSEELNIHQRINAVMKKLDYVQKENKKVNNQYTFVSHDAVTAAVRVHLVDEGIVVIPSVTNHIQDGNRTEVDLQVDFVNIDKPEDKVSINVFGYGVDQQDKGPGKAFSYAKKYAFLQLFALETGDDPERSNIDHEPEKKKREPLKGKLSWTKLKAEIHKAQSAVGRCTSIEELEDVMVEYQEPIAQAKKEAIDLIKKSDKDEDGQSFLDTYNSVKSALEAMQDNEDEFKGIMG